MSTWTSIRWAYHFRVFIGNFPTKCANSSHLLLPIRYLMLCGATTQLTEIDLSNVPLHCSEITIFEQSDRRGCRVSEMWENTCILAHTQVCESKFKIQNCTEYKLSNETLLRTSSGLVTSINSFCWPCDYLLSLPQARRKRRIEDILFMWQPH